jgi:Holliday junction resolvase RusA-like endonuclease
MISFTLAIDPVPKARPKFRRQGKWVRTYTPSETVRFESDFKVLARPYKPEKPLEGPVKLLIDFYFRRPKSVPKKRVYPSVKPDIDNLIKAVKDAGNSYFWKDDSLICEIAAGKYYSTDQTSFIEITILEMQDATI